MKSRALDASQIEVRLIETIRVRFGVALSPSAKLDDIGIDSLAMAELISELEDKFDVRFDQDIFEVDTIRDLAAHIEQRRPANH